MQNTFEKQQLRDACRYERLWKRGQKSRAQTYFDIEGETARLVPLLMQDREEAMRTGKTVRRTVNAGHS